MYQLIISMQLQTTQGYADFTITCAQLYYTQDMMMSPYPVHNSSFPCNYTRYDDVIITCAHSHNHVVIQVIVLIQCKAHNMRSTPTVPTTSTSSSTNRNCPYKTRTNQTKLVFRNEMREKISSPALAKSI